MRARRGGQAWIMDLRGQVTGSPLNMEFQGRGNRGHWCPGPRVSSFPELFATSRHRAASASRSSAMSAVARRGSGSTSASARLPARRHAAPGDQQPPPAEPERCPRCGAPLTIVVSRTPVLPDRAKEEPTGPGPPVFALSNQRWSRQCVCGILPPVMTFIRVAAQTLRGRAKDETL